MKKIFLSMTGILVAGFVMAQTELDAIKFIQTDIQGTARYTAMAGAFGALGGDASAIKDNPAGLGIFRSSELSFTGALLTQDTKSTWNGQESKESMSKSKINNLSYIIATPTWAAEHGATSGLMSSNFAFTYNNVKHFDRCINIKSGKTVGASLTNVMADLANLAQVAPDDISYNNTQIGWLSVLGYDSYLISPYDNGWFSDFGYDAGTKSTEHPTPSYALKESGYIDEYGLSWAGNFSNRFYLGLGLNLQTMSYSLSSIYSEEISSNHFRLNNEYTISGVGLNFNIGGLYKISNALRVSAALHIHTAMAVTQYYYPTVSHLNVEKGPAEQQSEAYAVSKPLSANAGLAYVLGKKGLVSAEYVYTNYRNTSFSNTGGQKLSFQYNEINKGMSSMYNAGHTLKIGGEYRVSDNFKARAGFALVDIGGVTSSNAAKMLFANSLQTDAEYFMPQGSMYFTAGVGYQEDGWFFDFALMHKREKQKFMPFNSDRITPATVNLANTNLVATFGLRF